MKKMIALSVLLAGITGIAQAAEDQDITWTFDDFDANCNVVDTVAAEVAQQPKVAAVARPAAEHTTPAQQDDGTGELGW